MYPQNVAEITEIPTLSQIRHSRFNEEKNNTPHSETLILKHLICVTIEN